MNKLYEVIGIDNRGIHESPFGYVYLGLKGENVGRIGFGATRDNPDRLAIWPCRETPNDMDLTTLDRVRAALIKTFKGVTP